MKNLLKKFWEWILWSSKDPNKVALTVKGSVIAAIPVILWVTGAMHVGGASSDGLVDLGATAGEVAGNLVGVVGVLITTWGLIRKIILSIKAMFGR